MKDCFQVKSCACNPVHFINTLLISIVLYLHHGNYTNNYFSILAENCVDELLQKFAVGGFFFFSGIKLTLSNINYPALVFLKKRFCRIYMLYLIALIIAYVSSYPFMNNGAYPAISTMILHVFCIQTLLPNCFGNDFHTLWFISILFFCYILFIVTRKDLVDTQKIMAKQGVIFILISIIWIFTLKHDIKIFSRDFAIYLAFFSLGMVSSKYDITRVNKYHFLASGLIGNLLLLIIYNKICINTWYEYIVYAPLVILSNLSLFYFLCFYLKKINFADSAKEIISKYSYSSFCIFLLHRSIWSIMATLYPKGTLLQWVYIVLLGIPIIFLCSYSLQLFFDILIKYLTSIVRHDRQHDRNCPPARP